MHALPYVTMSFGQFSGNPISVPMSERLASVRGSKRAPSNRADALGSTEAEQKDVLDHSLTRKKEQDEMTTKEEAGQSGQSNPSPDLDHTIQVYLRDRSYIQAPK